MKICYAIAELVEGVGQTTMLSQITSFDPSKYRSAIVTTRVQKFSPALFEGSDIHVSNSYYTSLVNSDLVEYFKRFDIVVIKSGLPFFLAALMSKVTTIYVFHQPDPVLLFSGRVRLNRLAARLLERPILLKRADAFISVSPWVAKWYKDHFNIDSVIIPDSFDLSKFKPQKKYSLSPEKFPKLLCVGWGGFSGRKRSHELIEFMPKIKSIYPDVQLSIVGLSEAEIIELTDFSKMNKASDVVRLVGKLSEENLINEYNSADLYVTSTISEGFYRPIIEAFACGVPVVVRNAADIVDTVCLSPLQHVKASSAGTAYNGTLNSFVKAVELALANKEKYSVAGIKYAQQFDNRKQLPKYFELYEKLLRRDVSHFK